MLNSKNYQNKKIKPALLSVKTLAEIFFVVLLVFTSSQAGAQSWLTTGNAATDTATNFIGTTDNKGLIFRTNNQKRMFLSNTGKLGIGTLAPVNEIDLVTASSARLGIKANGGSGAFLFMDKSLTTDNATVSYRTAGVGKWQTGTIANNDFVINNLSLSAKALYINLSNNNVGIGKTTPSTTLDVNGVITSAGGNSANWNTAYSWGNHATAGYFTGIVSNFYLPRFNGISFVTSLLYDSGSRIGLGTASPLSRLHVEGDSASTADVIYSKVNYTGTSDVRAIETLSQPAAGYGYGMYSRGGYTGVYAQGLGGTGYTSFVYGVFAAAGGTSGSAFGIRGNAIGTGTNYGVYGIASGGTTNWAGYFSGNTYVSADVGIGTSTPSAKLHVVQSVSGDTTAVFSNAAGPNISYIHQGAAGDWYMRSAANNGRIIIQDQSSVARIGIGTSSPTCKIEANDDNTTSQHSYYFKSSPSGGTGTTPFEIYFLPASTYTVGSSLLKVTANTALGYNQGMTGVDINLTNTDGNRTAVYANPGGPAGTGTYQRWGVFATADCYAAGTWQTSDERIKKNIKPVENALDKILQLDAKSYEFKTEEYPYVATSPGRQYGFLAQQLEKVLPESVRDIDAPMHEKDADGKEKYFRFKGVNYVMLIPVLTQAIKEQQDIITETQKQNENLAVKLITVESQLAAMKAGMDEMQNCVSQLCLSNESALLKSSSANNSELPFIKQNQPNPFNTITVINYSVPEKINNAQIIFRDLSGNLLKTILINEKGKGQIVVNANTFSPGTYTYTLELNAESMDTKLMVITK